MDAAMAENLHTIKRERVDNGADGSLMITKDIYGAAIKINNEVYLSDKTMYVLAPPLEMESIDPPHNDHTYADMDYLCVDVFIMDIPISPECAVLSDVMDVNPNAAVKNAMDIKIEPMLREKDKLIQKHSSLTTDEFNDNKFHDSFNQTAVIKEELDIEYMTYANDYNDFIKLKNLSQLPYKCKHCFLTFKVFSDLKVHIQKHFIKNDFKCEICKQDFNTKHDLLKHSYSHMKTYTCKFCQRIFITQQHYKNHVKKHEAGGSLRCSNCNKMFSTPQSCTGHMKLCMSKPKISAKALTISETVDDESFYKCSFCKKDFRAYSLFKIHLIEVHPEKELYVCKYCFMSFNIQSSFIIHLKIHESKLGQLCCLKCEINLENCTCSNISHIKSIKCKICEINFETEILLQEHLKVSHIYQEFECNYCGEKFTSEWDKITHTIVHRYEIAKPESRLDILNKMHNEFIHECTDCSIKFSNKSLMLEHLKNYIHHEKCYSKKKAMVILKQCDISQLRCEICNKIFIHSYAKNIHMDIHTKIFNKLKYINCNIYDRQSKFVCDLCDKNFFSPRTYKRHLLTHVK